MWRPSGIDSWSPFDSNCTNCHNYLDDLTSPTATCVPPDLIIGNKVLDLYLRHSFPQLSEGKTKTTLVSKAYRNDLD